LRAHGFDAEARCAIGLPAARLDEAPFPEALEYAEGAVRQDMTFAGVAGDAADLTIFAAFMVDCPAKGEFVQHALLVL
jgi:hypothetical protein